MNVPAEAVEDDGQGLTGNARPKNRDRSLAGYGTFWARMSYVRLLDSSGRLSLCQALRQELCSTVVPQTT